MEKARGVTFVFLIRAFVFICMARRICAGGSTTADILAAPTYTPPVLPEVPPITKFPDSSSESLPSFSALLGATQTVAFKNWLVAIRRALHSWPETAYTEHNTSALVQRLLKELGIRFTAGWGVNTVGISEEDAERARERKEGTGIVAEIGSGTPCVALRADMDALPIFEQTDVPFRSKVDGKMHACGHDAHTTMLLGAAALLKTLEPHLKGTVRLIFQPAEEGGGGALMMRNEGVLKVFPPVELIFGLHVAPWNPTGTLETKVGVFMAATSR